jgi:predicted O-linked N-acetylglucosamine transferase (SPINDLY family)
VARSGLARHPADAGLWEALANALLYAGAVAEATAALSRALAVEPGASKCHSNLLFARSYDETLSNRGFFAAFRDWERRHAGPIHASTERAKPPRAGRTRIRIGYVSAELRDHPIAQLIEDVFSHHDRSRFEIFAYAQVENPDAVTARLRSKADGWRSIVGIGDNAAADLVRGDGIDILVMLGAHTGGNRPLILAHRPAPVQATMHDLSTTGLRTVDAWLTDRVLHPPDTTEGHTEEFVRLPSLYLHRVPERSPEVSELPCLRAGTVTFGSFSIPPKLNDRVLRLWSRVLAAVPGSRLVIGHNAAYADPLIGSRFRHRCRAAGIAAERLHLVGDHVGRDAHLARVGSLDIALDPFPFNGGITTFEALWMGVPVVTLEGERFAARGCASHLAQVGLDHLIAADEQAYVDIAAGLAQSPDALAELRRSLRATVRSSRLCDAPAYVAALEEALLDLRSRLEPT